MQDGQSLSGIARENGVTLGAMAKANPQLRDLNAIFPGDVLNLPSSMPAAAAPVAPATASPTQVDGVTPHSQEDFPDTALGTSKDTIKRSGCLLASLTMVASKVAPGNDGTTLPKANDAVVAAGGFSGADLITTTAARSLGMKQTERSAPISTDAIATELAAGRPVVLGVDFMVGSSSGRSDADHFLVLTRQDADNPNLFHGIDPLGGGAVTFALGDDGSLRSTNGRHAYRATESIFHSAAE